MTTSSRHRIYSPEPIQRAFEWADNCSLDLPVIETTLIKARGYQLAQNLDAQGDLPAQNVCSRDGYALLASDTLGTSDYNPLPLRLVNTSQNVSRGNTLAVIAGDPLPDGADAVLALDKAELRGRLIDVTSSLAPGDGVIRQAEECRQGEQLAKAGRILRPQDIAHLAQAGITQVPVRQRPRVNLLLAGQFKLDSNGVMLQALIERDGGIPGQPQIADTRQTLENQLKQSNCDLTLVIGGSGYSDRDYSHAALQACGEVQVDGVTLHPGGSMILGKVGTRAVIILPGTPLACLCAYDFVAARLLRRTNGYHNWFAYERRRITLSRKLVSNIGRTEVARLRINNDQGEPVAVADDRLLVSTVRADGFVIVPENNEGFASGSQLEAFLY